MKRGKKKKSEEEEEETNVVEECDETKEGERTKRRLGASAEIQAKGDEMTHFTERRMFKFPFSFPSLLGSSVEYLEERGKVQLRK